MKTQALRVEKGWLLVPSSQSSTRRRVRIEAGGRLLHDFETPLSREGEVDWWASIDLRNQLGHEVVISSEQESLFRELRLSDEGPETSVSYQEKRRPLFHFSPRRGWLNDPNGLVYFRGEYHLFFQYNPYFTEWGNMHWGHAVSRDLTHWRELDIALYPDEHGAMFSGSAVWDRARTSGLGTDPEGPMVLFYTGASDRPVQCLAYSEDGRSVAKFFGNPILPYLTGSTRDPKVFWHEATSRWIMALYAGEAAEPGAQERHTVHLLSSADLIHWQPESVVRGGLGQDHFLFECPDLFPLPSAGGELWVLIGANGEYQLGSFDGYEFRATSGRLRFVTNGTFYAGQTFHDEPAGRRIMIGWLRCPSPDMPFNQCMSVPLEFALRDTSEGARLAVRPVPELDTLRHHIREFGARTLAEGEALFSSTLLDGFDLCFSVSGDSKGQLAISLRGLTFVYCGATRELRGPGLTVDLPVSAGGVDFRILGDRTSLEIFAAGGLIYWPVSVVGDLTDNQVGVTAQDGVMRLTAATLSEMDSSWNS